MPEFEPFDPDKHTAIDLPGGRKATEYLASERSPEGQAWNIPQIWFDTETGKPKFFKGDMAWNAAQDYEKRTGNRFPRYDTIPDAVSAAKKMSASGGASKKSLINRSGNR
jgi:hypothetical protein